MLSKITLLIIASLLYIDQIQADTRLRIAGSKTLYYFMTFAAEDYAKMKHQISPIVEATGSGSGINLFCRGKIDIAASSRRISAEEKKFCYREGIKEIREIVLGYDAIVFATSKESALNGTSINALYKAIAAKLPFKNKILENFYNRWDQIDASLPHQNIEIYGPSLNSGTKQILMEYFAREYCMPNKVFHVKFPDQKERLKNCLASRQDKKYIEIGENQNLLMQKILQNKNAIAILNYSHLITHQKDVKILPINNILPSAEAILEKTYPLSKTLYLYYSEEGLQERNALKDFIDYLKYSDLLGAKGFLSSKGLIDK
jgi:phosphate transport system substrate-binding protein